MTKLCVAGSQHPFGLSASLLAQDWKIPVAQSHLADLPSVETVSEALAAMPGLLFLWGHSTNRPATCKPECTPHPTRPVRLTSRIPSSGTEDQRGA